VEIGELRRDAPYLSAVVINKKNTSGYPAGQRKNPSPRPGISFNNMCLYMNYKENTKYGY